MPTISQIVLADGQATPANKTFTPVTSQKGDSPAVWYERSASSPLGYRRLTIFVTAKTNAVSKVRIVIADPVLASFGANCCIDSNTPQVSYTDFFDCTFSLPASSTLANRKDILAYAKNVLANAFVIAAVENLEPAF